MTELKNILTGFSKSEKVAVGIFLTTLVIIQVITGSTLLSFTAAMLGAFYVTLVRKGSRLCYIFGALQIMLYIYISLSSKFYGDVMLNSFNLIMQPIGWYLWTKRSNDGGIVEPKSLTKKNLVTLLILWAVIIMFYGQWLKTLGGNTPMIDAITTVSSITAMLLSVQAFKDQWTFWIICNTTSIFMWTLALLRGDNSATPMVIMWIAYLINSLFAKKEWNKLEKKDLA